MVEPTFFDQWDEQWASPSDDGSLLGASEESVRIGFASNRRAGPDDTDAARSGLFKSRKHAWDNHTKNGDLEFAFEHWHGPGGAGVAGHDNCLHVLLQEELCVLAGKAHHGAG